jgi:hypothetical protein
MTIIQRWFGSRDERTTSLEAQQGASRWRSACISTSACLRRSRVRVRLPGPFPRLPPTNGGSVPGAIPGTSDADNRALRVCRLLNRHRVRYLIAGGVAANLHGSVRATRDVDILVPRDLQNTRRLLTALTELPYRIAAELDAADVVTKPFTIVGDDPRVDILTVACSVTFDRAWPGRMERRIGRVRVPYLGLDDLLASKRTGRASDAADIEALSQIRRRT